MGSGNNMKVFFVLLFVTGSVNGWWFIKKKISGSKIASTADKYIGSTKWSVASTHTTGSGTNKCNIFVADVLDEAGASVPQRHFWSWSPIGAGEWGNPSSSYLTSDACYTHVTSPRVGDIIGDGVHVGIVTGSSLTTSASSKEQKVVKNGWGFPSSTSGTVFWRYVC